MGTRIWVALPLWRPKWWLVPIWHMRRWQARREQGQQAGDVAKASPNPQGCVEGAPGWAIQSHLLLHFPCLQSEKQKLKLLFHILFGTSTKPSSSASILTIWNIRALPICFDSLTSFLGFSTDASGCNHLLNDPVLFVPFQLMIPESFSHWPLLWFPTDAAPVILCNRLRGEALG